MAQERKGRYWTEQRLANEIIGRAKRIFDKIQRAEEKLVLQMKPDKEAFNKLLEEYELGEKNLGKNHHFTLNCRQVIDVFGWPVTELFLICGICDGTQFEKLIEELKFIRTGLFGDRK